MTDKIIQRIQTVLIAVLIIIVLVMNNQINRIENTVNSNQNSIQSLYGQISNVNAGMSQMQVPDSLIQTYDQTVMNIHGDYTEANVDVTITFSEIGNNDTVYYTYRTATGSDRKHISTGFDPQMYEETVYGSWEKQLLNRGDDGSFYGRFVLDYAYNYEVKVVIETGENTISEPLQGLYLYEESIPAYDLDFQLYEYDTNGDFQYGLYFFEIEGWQEIQLESVLCYLYYDDQLIQSVDVFEQGDIHADDEYMKECYYSGEGHVDDAGSADFSVNFEVLFVVTDEMGRVFEHHWQMY